jgi:uncharacterized protein
MARRRQTPVSWPANAEPRALTVGTDDLAVSGLLARPDNARALVVLGHGAGAGMRHPFMARVATELAVRGVATLRYQFPYMEAGRRRTDPAPIAEATVRQALAAARAEAPELPLFAGGKSFGGRMTARAMAADPDPAVRGLVFLGFPLHPAGRPSTERAESLKAVSVPMLFVQGTRDALAELELLRPILARLGEGVSLRIVEGGDHSFQVLKRSGRTEDDVMTELCDVVAGWVLDRSGPRVAT